MCLFRKRSANGLLLVIILQKDTAFYPIESVRKYSYAPDWIKCCLFFGKLVSKGGHWQTTSLNMHMFLESKYYKIQRDNAQKIDPCGWVLLSCSLVCWEKANCSRLFKAYRNSTSFTLVLFLTAKEVPKF